MRNSFHFFVSLCLYKEKIHIAVVKPVQARQYLFLLPV